MDLICGDSLKVLPTLPDASVDAVVTDPPYNVGVEYASTNDGRTDYKEWSACWLAEVRRVCRGPVLFTCGIVNLGMWHEIARPNWVLCWWKPASSSRSPVGFNNWEPVLLYGQLPKRNYCDVVRTTEQAKLPVTHKKFPIAHPCPKPVEWAARLVGMLPPGSTVLDPFMGSGTVGIACVRAGCSFVGIEVDAAYFAVAQRRVADAQAQAPLFAEAK
jgi:site-specific DNA-methyltransferase (adenine-specific)